MKKARDRPELEELTLENEIIGQLFIELKHAKGKIPLHDIGVLLSEVYTEEELDAIFKST